MQFRDLKKQYAALKGDMDAAILDAVASATYIMGKPVKELETELAEYVGAKHCISCANGTDALSLALKVWNIGAGDAVFVPDFTFFSSAEVVSLEGATPVFVDVDGDTYNLSASDLERKIESVLAENKLVPKVIITVDLFGLPANYPELQKVADRYKLLILEDGAQGFGGRIGDRKACSFGDMSTTSFFPAKPLGCYGDGGALFTDNDEWAALADSYRVHGKGTFKYDNVRIGMNSRLDTLQAAVLKVKFKAFVEYELESVNKAAAQYTVKLQGTVGTPFIPEGYYSSWAQYTVQLSTKEERDSLQAKLKEHGVPSMIYYSTPMHGQTAYRAIRDRYGACPVTVRLCDTVLSLPIHPYITAEEVDRVCNLIINR